MHVDSITLILLAANVIFSFMAFNDQQLFAKYAFQIGAVLQRKEYHRILTGAFLHVHPPHLIMNMMSLYFIGPNIHAIFGGVGYVLIYFGSLLGSKALAILFKGNNPSYSAVGASGAISGIIFALIYFVPNTSFLLFFVIPCPAWMLGILFVGYSIFGIRTGHGNIGHEAHLGGAIIGMLIAIGLIPAVLPSNYWVVLLCLLPTGVMLYLMLERPDIFSQISRGQFQGLFRQRGPRIVRDRADRQFYSRKDELDTLLEKVSSYGYDSLSQREKLRLEELSK